MGVQSTSRCLWKGNISSQVKTLVLATQQATQQHRSKKLLVRQPLDLAEEGRLPQLGAEGAVEDVVAVDAVKDLHQDLLGVVQPVGCIPVYAVAGPSGRWSRRPLLRRPKALPPALPPALPQPRLNRLRPRHLRRAPDAVAGRVSLLKRSGRL